MSVKLTEGAIEALAKGSEVPCPVLQLLNTRPIYSNSGPSRFRLMLSDGLHSLSCFMLSTQLNGLLEEKRLVPHCVCRLKKTITNTLSDGRRVVIVNDMEIMKSAEEIGRKIGNPTPVQYQSDAAGKAASPQKPASSTSTTVPGSSRNYSSGERHAMQAPSSGHGRGLVKKTPMVVSSSSDASTTTGTMPISSLNPYQTKWTIRARVTNKSNIRTWSNSKGEGKLFSFNIVDESGEIKVTAFNKEVDKFFPLIEQNKVYYISKASLKVANKMYTTLKNEYEMSLNANSSIVLCGDSQDVPTMKCDFVPIAELEKRDKDAIVDVIGVCRSAEEVSRITTKSSREVSKRALSLMDTTGKAVTLTLWGEEAENFDGSGQPVVAIKGARLSDFGGISLTTLFSSTVMVNPVIPEASRLRAWYDKTGHALTGQSLSEMRSAGSGANVNWKTLSDVKNEHLGQGEKAEYFSCVATVLFLRKENCLYHACPSAACNKKVQDLENELYRCEKCNKEFPNFKYRLLLSANIADAGDNQWVTCFQETAEALLGHSAETLGQLRHTNEAAFDEIFEEASFKTHIFKTRVKLETYNTGHLGVYGVLVYVIRETFAVPAHDESRVKAIVMEVHPVEHREYSRRLIQNIRKMAD